jgi:hypothetical protein
LESEGKPIIESELIKEYGVDYLKAADLLIEAGLKKTNDKDKSEFYIWKRS